MRLASTIVHTCRKTGYADCIIISVDDEDGRGKKI
jgi:hypothetical protein